MTFLASRRTTPLTPMSFMPLISTSPPLPPPSLPPPCPAAVPPPTSLPVSQFHPPFASKHDLFLSPAHPICCIFVARVWISHWKPHSFTCDFCFLCQFSSFTCFVFVLFSIHTFCLKALFLEKNNHFCNKYEKKIRR